MFSFIAENKYGEQLELTHNPAYAVSNISGFDPPAAVINATKNAGFDGMVYNSSSMEPRTITITLAVNGPAEVNRLQLYRLFKSKEPVRLYYRTETRDVYIDGYVQTFSVAFFEKKETAQIVVYCPLPALNQNGRPDEEIIDMSGPLFEFPFDIDSEGIPFSEAVTEQTVQVVNLGDLETGTTINIYFNGAVTTPKIYSDSTGGHMFINTSMQAGDELKICTIPGKKEITRIRNGVKTSLLGYLDGSWLVMVPGYNQITITAASGGDKLIAVFDTVGQFEGV